MLSVIFGSNLYIEIPILFSKYFFISNIFFHLKELCLKVPYLMATSINLFSKIQNPFVMASECIIERANRNRHILRFL